MIRKQHTGSVRAVLPLVFLAGTVFGMLAMGILTANFSDAYNPKRKRRHPDRGHVAQPRQKAVGESPQL